MRITKAHVKKVSGKNESEHTHIVRVLQDEQMRKIQHQQNEQQEKLKSKAHVKPHKPRKS